MSHKQDKKRNLLIHSARTLIREFPQDLPTVDTICKRSHMAKGTFFLYFSSKEYLLNSLLEEEFQSFLNQVESQIQAHYQYKKLSSKEFSELFCEQLGQATLLLALWPHIYAISQKINKKSVVKQIFTKWTHRLIGRVSTLTPANHKRVSEFFFLILSGALLNEGLQIDISQGATLKHLSWALDEIFMDKKENKSENSGLNLYANY